MGMCDPSAYFVNHHQNYMYKEYGEMAGLSTAIKGFVFLRVSIWRFSLTEPISRAVPERAYDSTAFLMRLP